MSRTPGTLPVAAFLSIAMLCAAGTSYAQTPDKGGSSSNTTGAGNTPGTNAPGSPAVGGAITTSRPLLGDVAPNFKLMSFDGREFELKQYREQASVVLVFLHERDGGYASYDGLEDRLRRNDIRVLFLCQDGKTTRGEPYIGAPVLHDRWGDTARMYGLYNLLNKETVPAVVFIDRSGHIRYYGAGYIPNAESVGDAAIKILEPESAAEDLPISQS